MRRCCCLLHAMDSVQRGASASSHFAGTASATSHPLLLIPCRVGGDTRGVRYGMKTSSSPRADRSQHSSGCGMPPVLAYVMISGLSRGMSWPSSTRRMLIVRYGVNAKCSQMTLPCASGQAQSKEASEGATIAFESMQLSRPPCFVAGCESYRHSCKLQAQQQCSSGKA